MANRILLKKSSTAAKVPVVGDLEYGELAINYTDGKLHYKTNANEIDAFSSNTATATLTNKTITNPTINGLNEWAAGTTIQFLVTNGAGQLMYASLDNLLTSGYDNSTVTTFPTGDYMGLEAYLGSGAIDSFGISLVKVFSCMDPVGSLQTTDLGALA
jgi:hypothetical protein